jgi:hypothetical protein
LQQVAVAEVLHDVLNPAEHGLGAAHPCRLAEDDGTHGRMFGQIVHNVAQVRCERGSPLSRRIGAGRNPSVPVGELRDGQQVARLGASCELRAEFGQRVRGGGCLRGDGCQQIVGGFRKQVVDAGFFGLSCDQGGKAGRDVVKRLGNQPANSGRYSVQVFG